MAFSIINYPKLEQNKISFVIAFDKSISVSRENYVAALRKNSSLVKFTLFCPLHFGKIVMSRLITIHGVVR